MPWETVTSKDNKLIRHIVRLAADGRYRRAQGEYVCEGEKLLWEALRDGVEVRTVLWEREALALARERGEGRIKALEASGRRLVEVPDNIFRAASILETYQGPLFVCALAHRELPREGRRFIALENVQDPGNVGTVIRTADAFSMDGVWLIDAAADPYQPKAVRAAMGSLFRMPVYRTDADTFFEAMRGLDAEVYAAALTENARSVRDVKLDRCAVIIGNEGRGLRRETIERCSQSIIIPMTGNAESLNAAIAAAIMMWEMNGCR